MKKPFVFVLIFSYYLSTAQVSFNDFFVSKTMRLDFYHAGDSRSEQVYFEQVKQEPYWGGSKTNLTDKFDYGAYKFTVSDSASGKIIYSRGYSSLFEEWQATDEAKKISRSFYETIVFPYPKKTVRVKIESRDKQNKFKEVFAITLNPENYFIKKEGPLRSDSYKLLDSGDPSVKVDIVLVPEGYAKEELPKLKKDAGRFAEYLFKHAPYTDSKNKFNIWLVEAVSQESGTDIPASGIWKNTVVNSNFYTFDSERYLTTMDIKSIRDIAGNVPYDQIFVLVNSKKYGGGGIFNDYSMCSSDNESSEWVFIHEFGHAFAGLADEYFDSQVSVSDYYDLKSEPWNPNITTLVNFDKKWKSLVVSDMPVPTPVNEKFREQAGVYEGASYVAKGMFRPYQSCEMKELRAGFCPVCSKAIIEMIDFYTK